MKKKRMIKEEIISEICNDTGVSRYIVERVIKAMFDNITLALSQGKEVQFSGFGSFIPKERAARMGRNPHTKEPVPIPARVIPTFKPGKLLNEAVIKNVKISKK